MSTPAKQDMTPDQARATHPALTAWVGASAGTGKTHVLTARVLRLMLTGTEPENIVCLTFTKAAAAEMKNRIFSELGGWTTMTDEALGAVIRSRTDENADADMLVRARQLFAKVLDLSGGLQIQTFHSFCQALLGRFPLEANMVPGFEGLDEADAAALMGTARDTMLEQTREVGALDLRKALDVVAGLVTERTFDEVIDRLSFEAPLLARASNAYGGIQGLSEALFQRLGLKPKQQATPTIHEGLADGNADFIGLRALAGALAGGTAADQRRGEIINTLLTLPENKRAAYWDQYKTAFLTKAGSPLATVATKKVLASDSNLEGIIAIEQQRLANLEDILVRINAAYATTALLQLGLTQLGLYRRMKSERGVVDFDDMINATVGLFAAPSVAPWILYKLDNRIDHILVDEAQDTNREQWRIVETLAAEFFAGVGARDITRTVFAVGDAKQSIFSFQRADPKQFIAARNRIFARATEMARPVEAVPLSLSFRSGEAVLSLVDAVFAPGVRAAQGLSSDNELVQHRYHRTGQAGLVEMWPLEQPVVAEKETESGWQPPVVQETVDDAEQRAAWRIARHIQCAIGQHMLPARGRTVAAGDILVLVRRRTAFVDHLVKALKALSVPVAGRDRMTLLDELPVMDLLAIARFALLPTDDLTLATVLKSPFVGCTEDDVFMLAHGRKGSLWHALYMQRDSDRFKSTYALLVSILNRADLDGPFEFFNHLLIDLEGRRKLAGRLGEEVHDPVDELLEEALQYELNQAASLIGFVEYITRNNAQIKRDMEEAGDKVRIMTSHSAKGLQAPIVYLSDLVGLPDLTKDGRLLALPASEAGMPAIPLWSSVAKGLSEVDDAKAALKERQLAEYRRLLYVALTRAEDELYIAGWRGPREPDEDCWYSLIENGFSQLSTKAVTLPDGREVKRYEVEQTAKPVIKSGLKVSEGGIISPPAWLHAPMPDEPAPSRPLSPSKPDEEPAGFGPLERVSNDRFMRGNLLHALLQWLPEVEPADRENAAMRYLTRASDLRDDQKITFWQEVQAILNHSELGYLFGPMSRAEVPIAGLVKTPQQPEGRPVSGQVDRLVVLDDEVLIIDYKTNRPPPADVAHVPSVYLRQMALYRRALASVYKTKTIKAALLWTHDARLMMLPEELLEDALRHAKI